MNQVTLIKENIQEHQGLSPNSRPCRSCGAELRHTFIDLGMSPLANSNVAPDDLTRMEPFYPLHAYVCSDCFLVQLEQFETPQHIFGDYVYFSSYSASWVDHARRYVDMISERLSLGRKSQVVEIASNDGYLLQFFVKRGIPALGIEPAANVAKVAVERGIPTQVRFFGVQTAKEFLGQGIHADLIVANNVLAHVPDLHDFIGGLKCLLAPTGVVTVEFPHLLHLFQQCQFDTIYHEHFSYFSLLSVMNAFEQHGLSIFDVDELTTHGGSLRIYAKHRVDDSQAPSSAVTELLNREKDYGLASLPTYASFKDKVIKTKRQLLAFLFEAKGAGKTIVGYGAPAKGNTLLNYCGIRSDLLDYVVDRSPHKQGLFLPGTHLAIHSPDKIAESKPDYLLILPWNLRDEIMDQMSYVHEWGCQFVTPLPHVRIY